MITRTKPVLKVPRKENESNWKEPPRRREFRYALDQVFYIGGRPVNQQSDDRADENDLQEQVVKRQAEEIKVQGTPKDRVDVFARGRRQPETTEITHYSPAFDCCVGDEDSKQRKDEQRDAGNQTAMQKSE